MNLEKYLTEDRNIFKSVNHLDDVITSTLNDISMFITHNDLDEKYDMELDDFDIRLTQIMKDFNAFVRKLK